MKLKKNYHKQVAAMAFALLLAMLPVQAHVYAADGSNESTENADASSDGNTEATATKNTEATAAENTEATPAAATDPVLEPDLSGTIPDGITIQGSDVSGMDAASAEAIVDAYLDGYRGATFTLNGQGTSKTATAGELGLTAKNNDVVAQALHYGKDGNPAERYLRKMELKKSGKNFTISLSADHNVLRSYIEAHAQELTTPPKNYGLVRENGTFILTDGAEGTEVITEQAIDQIANYMNHDWKGGDAVLNLPVKTVQPKGDKETLSQVQDLLGSYTTDYSPGNTARRRNVERAAQLLNGHVLYPNETLSVYKTITPMTSDNGYEAAGAYVNGEVVQEEGGGVCQVATTCYNAILNAELATETRASHSMTVHYAPLSQDAAIAGEADGSSYLKDLQFTNNREIPIYLEFITDGSNLTVNVYGKETRPADRVVTYEPEITEVFPYSIQFTEDPNQPVGYCAKVSSGQTGYKARLWKVVTVAGVEESRNLQNHSSYNMKPASYIIGSHSDDPNVQAQVSAAIATQDVNTIVGTVSSISGTLPPIIVDTKGQSDLAKLAAGASGAAGANTTGEAPAPAADTAQPAADAAQPAEAPAQ